MLNIYTFWNVGFCFLVFSDCTFNVSDKCPLSNEFISNSQQMVLISRFLTYILETLEWYLLSEQSTS